MRISDWSSDVCSSDLLVERTDGDRLAALVPVRADGEAVRLVPQALEVEEHGMVERETDLPPVRHVEYLPPFAPMVRPLGDADHADILYAHILQYGAGGGKLPLRRTSVVEGKRGSVRVG